MRKWIIVLLVLIVGAIIGYNYIYREHRNIEEEEAVFRISSAQILEEFQINSEASESKYLNKTIEVFGLITDLNHQNITLDDAVFCQFNQSIIKELLKTQEIQIKGRFIGYDDLLEQIKLDQCYIIN